VLAGRGPSFCAGFDVERGGPGFGWATDAVSDAVDLEQRLARFMRVWDCPKPVVAAVHGNCLAAATVLCTLADLTLVASGTAAEIRDLVDAMPVELKVRTAAPRRFAEIACGIDGVDAVRIDGDVVVVATRRPAAVLEEAVPRAVDEGLGVSELVPADRSLEGIFGRLVRLHRGVRS
jgi:hypothetical protein